MAGLGWGLSGLSMIHGCQKTRIQDGVAGSRNDARQHGTICIDGRRLFPDSPDSTDLVRHFHSDSKDFNDIQQIMSSGNVVRMFKVVSKTGIITYYGLNPHNHVSQAGWEDMFLMDRVLDQWGNYYDVTYNKDAADFTSTGIQVTRIDYTGHMPDSSSTPGKPFYSVAFDYTNRTDIRHSRGLITDLPTTQRLISISVVPFGAPIADLPLRQYTLDYLPDQEMLPSRLAQIKLCFRDPGASDGTGMSCPKPLVFDWEGGGNEWLPTPSYPPPPAIATPYD